MLSLVADAVVVHGEVSFATRKTAGESRFCVLSNVMSLHVSPFTVCVYAVRVCTWDAAFVAHVR